MLGRHQLRDRLLEPPPGGGDDELVLTERVGYDRDPFAGIRVVPPRDAQCRVCHDRIVGGGDGLEVTAGGEQVAIRGRADDWANARLEPGSGRPVARSTGPRPRPFVPRLLWH